jgi:hypothetical protein
VLKLGKTKLIYSIAVLTNFNPLVFLVINELGLIIVLYLTYIISKARILVSYIPY